MSYLIDEFGLPPSQQSQSQQQPQRPLSGAELDYQHTARVNSQQPPAHYLKGPQPTWRAFVDEHGIHSSGNALPALKRGADWSPKKW